MIDKTKLLKELNKIPDFSSIEFAIIDGNGRTEFLDIALVDGKFIFEKKDKDLVTIGHVLTVAKIVKK